MPRRRAIKGVLAGFLGTFTSRYLDYRGYWLIGVVASELWSCNIDLLGQPPIGITPKAAFRRYAKQIFADQVSKSRIKVRYFAGAELKVTTNVEVVSGLVGGEMTEGHIVTFSATATMDNNRCYQCERAVFVAQHNSKLESRRNIGNWGYWRGRRSYLP
jgi:hypothetical protein